MKTTKNLIGMISLMLMFVISNSVNSQISIGTDYTLTPITGVSGSGATIIAEVTTTGGVSGTYLVNFKHPVDITSITASDPNGVKIYSVKTLSNDANNITFNTTTYVTPVTSLNKTNVVSLMVYLSGSTYSITGSVSTTTFKAVQATVDTAKAYNDGYLAGKAQKSAISVEKSEQISVYPNPVTSNVNIDVNGANNQVDMSSEATGFYMLNIIDLTGKVVKTVKIVKQ